MIKVLARSIREYKKASILTPLLVTVEVILECAIPFVIANLVNQMQAGCSMDVIVKYGLALIIMAIVSLIFGGPHRPVLRVICAKICSTKFRIIRSKTSINSRSPAWLPV